MELGWGEGEEEEGWGIGQATRGYRQDLGVQCGEWEWGRHQGKQGWKARLEGAGSCGKHSNYLTIEHYYYIFKTCGIIVEYSGKTFLYFIKWRKKKIIDNPPK